VHLCIKCGAEFTGKPEDLILKGCPQCGSKFFKYKNQEKPKEKSKTETETVETIMVKDGVYEVNLSSLMEYESVIVSDEEGKYLIDINFLLKKKLREKKKV
jgi:uncharacterized protein